MVSDPLANMLSSLTNAAKVGHPSVTIPASNLKLAVAELLKREGYLTDVVKKGKRIKKTIQCDLRYNDVRPKLQGAKRLSRPGRRVYWNGSNLQHSGRRRGTVILSTPQGLMTAGAARTAKVGGEALFEIW